MHGKEMSQLILEKFHPGNKNIIRLTLNDNSVLEGIFVGYYHDDLDDVDSPPDAWHFVPEKLVEKYNEAKRCAWQQACRPRLLHLF